MTEKEKLVELIRNLLPEADIKQGNQYTEILVPLNKLHSYAIELKENDQLMFDYLFCLTGVDLPDCIMLVYHLESTRFEHQLVVKVKTENRENPLVDTVSDVWVTSEFHEREIYDLLGVKFNYHKDLRRLFLEDEAGFPLRKDYKDEINIIER